MTSDQTLGRDEIRDLLREVGAVLARRGSEATIYVVGGAAMALSFDARRTTRDVDVAFRGDRADVEQAAAEVAARHNLPPDWLNGHAAAFMSNEPDDDAAELTLPGLRVVVASDAHLIAMKLRSMRDRDLADLDALFRHAGISTPQEAADIHNRMFDKSSIGFHGPEEALYEAKAVFDRAAALGRPIGARQTTAPATESHDGEHWVRPHNRRGNPVEGHWRRNRNG